MLLDPRRRVTRACGLIALGLALAACSETAAERIHRAHDLVLAHQPDEALVWYRKALDLIEKDDSPRAQVHRARALRGAADVYYLEKRDMKRAVEVYRELIQLCPEAPETLEARLYLAQILRTHNRDLRGAIGELTAALARNPPQSAELTYQVAKLYFELADYAQAALEAQTLADRFPTSAYVDDALLIRAQSLGMTEDRKAESVRAYLDFVERFKDSDLHPHALFELGKLRADLGEPEKAIDVWVQALQRHPDPQVVQGAIARVRKRLVETTPEAIGQKSAAFDHHKAPPRPKKEAPPAATSVEAAGGTADEAEREKHMPTEGGQADSPKTAEGKSP